MASALSIECPSCKVAPAKNSTLCPDCGEDLGALIHLRQRSRILYNEGLQLARSGDAAAAVDRLNLALREDPSHIDALLVLGKIHARQGRDADARRAWEAALQLAPGDLRVAQALDALSAQEAVAAKRSKEVEDERSEREKSAAAALRRKERGLRAASFAAGLVVFGFAVAIWNGARNEVSVASGPAPAASAASRPEPGVAMLPPAGVAVVGSAASSAVAAPVSAAASAPSPAAPDADATLSAAVDSALKRHASLQRLPLQVKVENAIVRVEGKVRNLFERYLVESTVRSVPGVGLVDLRNLSLNDTYVVKAGDTLSSIAARRYGSAEHWQALALHNRMDAPYRLRVGQRLALP